MTFHNNDKLPTETLLRNARIKFEKLLTQHTKEPEWQQFFTQHPYVLSLSLPLRLEPQDIIPLARPGKTEPDFIFYPRKIAQPPFYGAIEIKRADSKIVTVTRSNVAILSRDAETAIEQAKFYNENIRTSIMKRDNILFLGNDSYIFVVMGMTSELTTKLSDSFFQEMIQSKLPRNLQILPYDYLYKRFEQEVPPKLHLLVPTLKEQNYQQMVMSKVLLRSIDEIELSVRSYLTLRNANIRTLSELVKKTEKEMAEIYGFGKKSLDQIKEVLSNMGLHLNMTLLPDNLTKLKKTTKRKK